MAETYNRCEPVPVLRLDASLRCSDDPCGYRRGRRRQFVHQLIKIEFTVGDTPASFVRDLFNGEVGLQVGDEAFELQNHRRLGAHLSFSTKRTWRRTVAGHDVEIVKVRPRTYGTKPDAYTVRVDGQVVAEVEG